MQINAYFSLNLSFLFHFVEAELNKILQVKFLKRLN
jgi:hypothetical protein